MINIVSCEITCNDDPFCGWSLSIYCSGCTRNCPGCHNEQLQDFNYGIPTYEVDLIEYIRRRSDFISSVVYLGGDWVEYLDPLSRVSREASFYGLKNVLYTGYTLDSIDAKYLDYVDVVIDGEYMKNLPSEYKVPSSSNQKVYCRSYRGDSFIQVDPIVLPINQGS